MAKRNPTGEDAALTEQLQREALIARARRKLELEAQDVEEQRRAKLPLAIVERVEDGMRVFEYVRVEVMPMCADGCGQ